MVFAIVFLCLAATAGVLSPLEMGQQRAAGGKLSQRVGLYASSAIPVPS